MNKAHIISEFKKIPGVGVSIAHDLWDLGLCSINDLKKYNAQQLYDNLCTLKECKVDRCMLYVFRCAIYFTSEQKHDPKYLKWWNWKD